MTAVDPRQLPRHTRTEAAAYVIAQFQSLDLEPPSRVSEMHRVLSRGSIPFEDPDFFTALESQRDLHQLLFIFEQLGMHKDNPRFRNIVKHLLNDSALPQHDQDSPGRDRQFELYLAQGQRVLTLCSSKDLEHVFIVPTTIAAFHGHAVFLGVLLQQGQREAI